MATSLPRRMLVISALTVLAMAAVALTGLWHPNAPAAAMKVYLPAITLPTVIVAGLVDGINPCAFTVLLLFVTALLATLPSSPKQVSAARRRLLGMGSIYIGAIFLTYLALGVGFLHSIDIFTRGHLPARLGALFAVLLGLWMIKDYFLPDFGWRLQAPARVGELARHWARVATLPAMVAGGFLIGLCTVPCSGAVYLGVLSLLALQPTALLGYGYLVLYNLVFVAPLLAILAMASARPTLGGVAHWNLHHRERVRLVLGAGVVGMGLLLLATV